MNICYPVIALEPVLPKLASRDLMLNETSSKKSRNQELKALLGGAKVNIDGFLGRVEVSLRDLLELNQGDILRLENAADDIVSVEIDGKLKFKGQIGLRRFRKSIKIIEVIDTEKDSVKRAIEFFEHERRKRLDTISTSN